MLLCFSSGLKHYHEIGYKEMFEIFNVVTQELNQKAIVIDSDDLVDDPGAQNLL